MKNPELRLALIESGKSDQYRKIRNDLFSNDQQELDSIAYESDEMCNAVYGMNRDEAFECERIRKCALLQRRKIEDHISFLMKGNWDLYFITFDFSDKSLSSISYKTLDEKVSRAMSKVFDDYIKNVDYSPKDNRLHFHAIGCLTDAKEKIYFNEYRHIKIYKLDELFKYGFYDLVPIRRTDEDKVKLAKYITKLTLHSMKVKQSYVSVKKGSAYQKYKKLKESYARECRTKSRLFKMGSEAFDERETELLSGFSINLTPDSENE